MSLILKGLRVVDCSFGTAGPQATGLLADYGAEVIWVEAPGGDRLRQIEPGATSVFNRGKRSVMLDVERAEDRTQLLQLIDRADVFVEGWRPGVADALGLGYADLRARNPQLVYCSISGFGAKGRNRDLPAYESLVHALFGTMARQAGHRDGPIFEGLPFASTGAAHLAIIGILASLLRRLDDGHGRHVETSLVDGALAFHSMFWGESEASLAARAGPGIDLRGPTKSRLVTRSFLCGDGEYLGIHTGAVGAFSRLIEVLGLADRIPPTKTGVDIGSPLTPEQADLLESRIHDIFAAHPRAYWVERLRQADVCAIEHLHAASVFDEPQARHNHMVATVDDPVLGPVEQVAPAIRFDGAVPHLPTPAPRLGEDKVEQLLAGMWATSASAWRSQSAPASDPDTRALLDGIKILDLGAFYAGPYSSRLLADLGAEVIKLETIVGDPLRGLERPFFSAQAGKRSLAANLKDPGLSDALTGLIRWADIVHHNMRPGADERLGLSCAQVRDCNPDIVYLYAPGWGSTGPHGMRQSFAPMMSAYVGASYEVAGQYNEPLPSVGNEDPGNGLLGATALLIALLQRRTTGTALHCENPQLNATMGMMAHVVRDADGMAVGAERLDIMQMGIDALESLYQTSDGWVCLAVREDTEIRALETLLDVAILDQVDFATAAARRDNRDTLFERLRVAFDTRSTAEWLAHFAGSGVALVEPTGASFVHEFLNDPEQRDIGRIAEIHHPEKGLVRELAKLVRISDAAIPSHRLAPGLGEHSDEVLAWLGYDRDRIAGLRADGAIC